MRHGAVQGAGRGAVAVWSCAGPGTGVQSSKYPTTATKSKPWLHGYIRALRIFTSQSCQW